MRAGVADAPASLGPARERIWLPGPLEDGRAQARLAGPPAATSRAAPHDWPSRLPPLAQPPGATQLAEFSKK
jgi:hypothetical protein